MAIESLTARAQLSRMIRRSKLAAQAFGRRAESFAVLLLRLKGYAILERRFAAASGGRGEIDIIARQGTVIAFIEVKARADLDQAAHALSSRQRLRLLKGAEAYLAQRPRLAHLSPRFDAWLAAPGRWPRHIIDAWRDEP
jgi:putative endonuclease